MPPPLRPAKSGRPFCPYAQAPGAGTWPVQWRRPASYELEGEDKPEADIVVTVVRRVVVPVGGAAIQRVVEVAAAAYHAVIAPFGQVPYFIKP